MYMSYDNGYKMLCFREKKMYLITCISIRDMFCEISFIGEIIVIVSLRVRQRQKPVLV